MYNLYMTIADAIKRNNKIINREIISLSELRLFVNELTAKDYPPASIRNIFVGNNDYYGFKYKNVGGGIYVPEELKNLEDIVKLIAGPNNWLPVGSTLEYKLNVSTQNNVVDEYAVFNQKNSHEAEEILKHFKNLKVNFLKQTIDFEVFKKLLIIKTIYRNKRILREYLEIEKIDINKLVDIYRSIDNNQYDQKTDFDLKNILANDANQYFFNKPKTDIEFLLDSNNTIEKAIMSAMMEVR